MEATIRIRRPRGWFGRWRTLEVLLDGKVVASVPGGGCAHLSTQPGRHTLQVQMGWFTSPEYEVTCSSGGRLELWCRLPSPLAVVTFLSVPERAIQVLCEERSDGETRCAVASGEAGR